MDAIVTVIICVYNAGEFLRPAVRSVLGQTYPNLEVLIVDDGSTDGCVDRISDLTDARVRIIRQPNAGKPAAMNRALDEMSGHFYAVHDADDISDPSRIERQLKCMLENEDVAAVYCGYDLLMGGRRVAPLVDAKDRLQCRRDIDAFRMPSHDPTAMYRVSAIRDMRYDPELRLGEGLDYILRVGERYPMLVLGECLYTYRIHEASITKREPELRDRLSSTVLARARARRGMSDSHRRLNPPQAKAGRNRVADNNLAAHFIESVLSQRRRGRWLDAIRTGMTCSALHPLDMHYQKALVYSMCPMSIVSRIRQVGGE